MNSQQLFRLLQLNGGTFPTGGFSQSWGLETYVSEGTVQDAATFRAFLEVYLMSSIGRCEGPIICRAYELAGQLQDGGPETEPAALDEAAARLQDGGPETEPVDQAEAAAQLRQLEQLSCAVKVTKESREAGLRMGRAFGRVIEPLLDSRDVMPLREVFGGLGISYPVLYGCVCRLLDIELEEGLAAYIFSTANTLTQSALKLIPLGNVEAQSVLFEMEGVMDQVCRLAEATGIENITNFCPGIDIASLRHEELPVRLYMS